jgi:hypothetical protein
MKNYTATYMEIYLKIYIKQWLFLKWGFRKGRSSLHADCTLQQITEERRKLNLAVFVLFVDYEKSYDSLHRILTQWTVETDFIKGIYMCVCVYILVYLLILYIFIKIKRSHIKLFNWTNFKVL